MTTNCNQILLYKTSKDEFIIFSPPRRPFTLRYQNFLFVYCFSCNNFGHKAIDCRGYTRSDHLRNRNIGIYNTTSSDDYVSNKTKSYYGFVDGNNNSFAPLLDYNTKCSK